MAGSIFKIENPPELWAQSEKVPISSATREVMIAFTVRGLFGVKKQPPIQPEFSFEIQKEYALASLFLKSLKNFYVYYLAPLRNSTAGIVLKMIQRSKKSDALSIYSMSS